jgi:hypothetical protein
MPSSDSLLLPSQPLDGKSLLPGKLPPPLWSSRSIRQRRAKSNWWRYPYIHSPAASFLPLCIVAAIRYRTHTTGYYGQYGDDMTWPVLKQQMITRTDIHPHEGPLPIACEDHLQCKGLQWQRIELDTSMLLSIWPKYRNERETYRSYMKISIYVYTQPMHAYIHTYILSGAHEVHLDPARTEQASPSTILLIEQTPHHLGHIHTYIHTYIYTVHATPAHQGT